MTNFTSRADIMAWRKVERRRLIEARLVTDAGQRRRHANEIMARLSHFIGDLSGRSVSAYWPFRGEPDLRPWMEGLAERGGSCALPIVIEKNAPLVFRTWGKGGNLVSGVWNIPVPADGAEVVPNVVIAPVVGFDPACIGSGTAAGSSTAHWQPSRHARSSSGWAMPKQLLRPSTLCRTISRWNVIITEREVVVPAAAPMHR